MDKLIYDRTRRDVENALDNTNSSEFQKGAYNYTDLNRVEAWCEYIQEKLKEYGVEKQLEIKTNWSLKDYPTRLQIDRIRNNIKTLKEACFALLTEDIIYNNVLDYNQSNILEKILFDIDNYMKKMKIIIEMQYNIATTLVQQKYITIKVEE